MNLLITYTPKLWLETLFVTVAEWSKASDLRPFEQKLEWVQEKNFFFFFFQEKKISFEVNFGFYAIFQAICNFSIAIYGHFP